MLHALFLHSWGSSRRDWDRIAPVFPEGLFVDMRGFGDASAPPGRYDLASYVDDALDLVAGWEDYAVVGHSMGGKVALALAARRPPGLRRLLLVAPSPPTPEPMTEADRRANLAGHGSRAFAESTVAKVARAPISEPFRAHAVEDYVRASKRAWRAWMETGSKEDISGLMSQIEASVRIVVGSEDPVLRPKMLRREVVARLRDCTLEEIHGAGHLLPLEKPEELTAFLEAHL